MKEFYDNHHTMVEIVFTIVGLLVMFAVTALLHWLFPNIDKQGGDPWTDDGGIGGE